MAKVNWTNDQKNAIDYSSGALLVSAAAGSGKTAVLVRRLLRQVVDEGKDITKFLMITYTNAAARELRQKIGKALSDYEVTSENRDHLRRTRMDMHLAHISTIHAFCINLIRTHGYTIGLSGDMRIFDETQGEKLRAQLLEEIIEDCYGEEWFEPAAHALFGERDDRALTETILSLHASSRTQVYPERWLDKLASQSKGDIRIEQTPWGEYLLSRARADIETAIETNERALKIIAQDGQMAGAYLTAFVSDREMLGDIKRALDKGWDETVSAFERASFVSLGTLRKYEDENKKEFVKALRDRVKGIIKNLDEKYFFQTGEFIKYELKETAPIINALCRVAKLLDQAFTREKARMGVMDYQDLEHYAIKLLVKDYDAESDTVTPTELAYSLRGDWEEIMVDEYQDSNTIQDVIFRALSKDEQNLVMVGDVKQSIYRFRLADPGIFLNKYRTFKPYKAGATGKVCVNLSANFRSRDSVIDATNSIFSSVMTESLGDMEYTDKEKLYRHATYTEYDRAQAEAIIIDTGDGDDELPSNREVEAEWIADKIADMYNTRYMVQDGGEMRRMRYGDVVILMRTPSDKAVIYRDALAKRGIPCMCEKTGNVLSAPEVSMIISLLSVIDNPLNEIALTGALRSTLFAMSADDLSRIRLKGGSFIGALEKIAQEDKTETSGKCREFLKVYYSLRELAQDLPADRLIWELYLKTNALGLVGALPDGKTRRDNLMALYNYACEFEKGGYRGVYELLESIAELISKEKDIPNPVALNSDVVRIMSIHKSKGLEFPIVFVADLNHKFNLKDVQKKVIIHPELGIGLDILDEFPKTRISSMTRAAVSGKTLEQMKSEEMRIMYVALTRAKEKLFLVCTLPNLDSKLKGIHVRTDRKEKYQANDLNDITPLPWILTPLLYSREGGALAERIGILPEADAPSCNFKISIIPATDGKKQWKTETVADTDCAQVISGAEMEKNFNFVYPYAQAVQAPSKITATSLEIFGEDNTIVTDGFDKGADKSYTFRRPDIVRETALTPTEKGIAAHLAMQLIDFAKCTSLDGVKSELSRLYSLGQLTDEEYESISAEKIYAFFTSEVGREALLSEELKREFRFSLMVPVDGIAPGEKMLLQGVCDLFYQTPDGIVLVDFKTDSHPTETRAKENYTAQLNAYAYALERICAKKVIRKVLFFLATGQIMEID